MVPSPELLNLAFFPSSLHIDSMMWILTTKETSKAMEHIETISLPVGGRMSKNCLLHGIMLQGNHFLLITFRFLKTSWTPCSGTRCILCSSGLARLVLVGYVTCIMIHAPMKSYQRGCMTILQQTQTIAELFKCMHHMSSRQETDATAAGIRLLPTSSHAICQVSWGSW